ncbi:MAG: FHA domain-containing protein, partial [Candidatus Omnitrophica bacterium]|nr:FHA domain-containing protein [Candidatus Omnitrophota bacterium]
MIKKLHSCIALCVCLLLVLEQSGFAQIAPTLDMSSAFATLRSASTVETFRPLHVRSLSYDPRADSFNLLLDKGDSVQSKTHELTDATKQLLQYFLVGVTIPNDAFWVNLRPDQALQSIDPALAQTDVGKILLEADVQLKKDTALATSPQTQQGKKYWDRLYKKAEELFGYDQITIPTLTRPWIVPQEIIIRESASHAYIYKATLKVSLEQDYLKNSSEYSFDDPRMKALNEYASQLIRELIIPTLTKQINTAKRYAALRQVYYSLIMAQWFKSRFQGQSNVYARIIDKQDPFYLTSSTAWLPSDYFKQYLQSFKDGEYNIKQSAYTPYGQVIRSYFSGGAQLSLTMPRAPSASSPVVSQGPVTCIFSQRPDNAMVNAYLESVSVNGPHLDQVRVREVNRPEQRQAQERVSETSASVQNKPIVATKRAITRRGWLAAAVATLGVLFSSSVGVADSITSNQDKALTPLERSMEEEERRTQMQKAQTPELAAAEKVVIAGMRRQLQGFEYLDADAKEMIVQSLLRTLPELPAMQHAYTQGESDEKIARQLFDMLRGRYRIDSGENAFHLSDVLVQREANCIGSTQLFLLAAQAIGLDAQPIEVKNTLRNTSIYHVASLVKLKSGRVMMVDLLITDVGASESFILNAAYKKKGLYLIINKAYEDKALHKRIRTLTVPGLLAFVDINRNMYLPALEKDPNNAWGYDRQADFYKGSWDTDPRADYEKAEENYKKALSLDPELLDAHRGLGRVYEWMRKPQQALDEFSKAISFMEKIIPVEVLSKGTIENGPFAGNAELLLDLYSDRARMYRALGKTQDAERDMAKIKKASTYWYDIYLENQKYYPTDLSNKEQSGSSPITSWKRWVPLAIFCAGVLFAAPSVAQITAPAPIVIAQAANFRPFEMPGDFSDWQVDVAAEDIANGDRFLNRLGVEGMGVYLVLSEATGIPVDILVALEFAETGTVDDLISKKGALGPLQIMPHVIEATNKFLESKHLEIKAKGKIVSREEARHFAVFERFALQEGIDLERCDPRSALYDEYYARTVSAAHLLYFWEILNGKQLVEETSTRWIKVKGKKVKKTEVVRYLDSLEEGESRNFDIVRALIAYYNRGGDVLDILKEKGSKGLLELKGETGEHQQRFRIGLTLFSGQLKEAFDQQIHVAEAIMQEAQPTPEEELIVAQEVPLQAPVEVVQAQQTWHWIPGAWKYGMGLLSAMVLTWISTPKEKTSRQGVEEGVSSIREKASSPIASKSFSSQSSSMIARQIVRNVITQLREGTRESLVDSIPGLTSAMERAFRTGQYSLSYGQSRDGRKTVYLMGSFGGETVLSPSWTELGFKTDEPSFAEKMTAFQAYQTWKQAQVVFPQGDLRRAKQQFAAEIGEPFGIQLLHARSAGKIYYTIEVLKLLPERVLRSGAIKSVNFFADRDKAARFAQYVAQTKEVGIIANAIDFDRYMLTGFLLHEMGHAVWESLNGQQRRAFETIFRRCMTARAVVGVDFMGMSKETRQQYQGSVEEFFAENFMHYLVLGKDKMKEAVSERNGVLIDELFLFYASLYQEAGPMPAAEERIENQFGNFVGTVSTGETIVIAGKVRLYLEQRAGALFLVNAQTKQEYVLKPGEYVVGRGVHGDGAIALSSNLVSRIHAVISISAEGVVRLYDAGSSNGTFVEVAGKRDFSRGILFPLQEGGNLVGEAHEGNVINFGGLRLRLAQRAGSLVLVDDEILNEYQLREGENVVGRGVKHGVTLSHGYVSRIHAVISVFPNGTVLVYDAGSSNGTSIENAVSSPIETEKLVWGRVVFSSALSSEQIRAIQMAEPRLRPSDSGITTMNGVPRIVAHQGRMQVESRGALISDSSIEEIDEAFQHVLGDSLVDRIVDMAQAKKGEPVYILDWGAGDLTAAIGLSHRLEERLGINNNVYIIAFGDMYFPKNMNSIPAHVLFFLDTAENLVDQIRAYLKTGKLDLIYSFSALHNLLLPIDGQLSGEEFFIKHVSDLS